MFSGDEMRTKSRKTEIWSSSHLPLILSGTSSNEIYFVIGFVNCLLLYKQKALAEFEERLNPCSSQFGGGFFCLSDTVMLLHLVTPHLSVWSPKCSPALPAAGMWCFSVPDVWETLVIMEIRSAFTNRRFLTHSLSLWNLRTESENCVDFNNGITWFLIGILYCWKEVT